MDDELPVVSLTDDELLIQPKGEYLVFASEVSVATNSQVDVMLLARTLQSGMSRCEQEAVKRALIESARNLNSPIARRTRFKIQKMLPPPLKTAQIENIIIRLGAIAAEIPELWNLVTETRATDV